MGIEKGEESQAKGMFHIFNEIIIENFPNLKKVLPMQVQEASRTPNSFNRNRTSPRNIIIKTISTENKERTLKPIREKKQITYKGKHIKITADFSAETLKARRAWREVYQALNENTFSLRIFYSAKLSFKIDRKISFPQLTETKTICDHQATTTEDSTRNSANRR
jgi:hypothetical protein